MEDQEKRWRKHVGFYFVGVMTHETFHEGLQIIGVQFFHLVGTNPCFTDRRKVNLEDGDHQGFQGTAMAHGVEQRERGLETASHFHGDRDFAREVLPV